MAIPTQSEVNQVLFDYEVHTILKKETTDQDFLDKLSRFTDRALKQLNLDAFPGYELDAVAFKVGASLLLSSSSLTPAIDAKRIKSGNREVEYGDQKTILMNKFNQMFDDLPCLAIFDYSQELSC